jgi:drug/metabolite transporter (DMT)-like permease
MSVQTQLDGRLQASIPVGGAVLFAVVFGSIVPYALIIVGFTRIGAGAGSMAGMTEPIVAPLLAWFVLGQVLAPLQALGIAVTIGCVAVVEQQRFRHARANEILVAEL